MMHFETVLSESEKHFSCPYCGETISMLLEELHGSQSYIEDCEVCCRPIQIRFQVEGGEIVNLVATRA